jgi:hypothetical protein
MFNFLFDGKIGDILAPVVPSNQLFLAIQHFKNDQIPNLLLTTGYDGTRQIHGEYSAIHVACRYNNRPALDLLLSKGTNILLMDSQGNTPLHYAAKYGHLDLCKYLIERGCQAGIRNKQSRTAYDVAESHLVRQYLLPIVLQPDQQPNQYSAPPAVVNLQQPLHGYSPPGTNIQQPMMNGLPPQPAGSFQQPVGGNPSPPLPHPTFSPHHPAPSHNPVYPSFTGGNQQLPTLATGQQSGNNSNVNVPPMQAYTPAYQPAPTAIKPNSGGTTRIIQPGTIILKFLTIYHSLIFIFLFFIRRIPFFSIGPGVTTKIWSHYRK